MKAFFLTLALILVLGGGAYYIVNYAPNGLHALSGVGALRLNSAVYPLYSEVTWPAPYFATRSGLSGIETHVLAAHDTMDISSVTGAFSSYYMQKLAADGWNKDISREAGGPGSSVEAYEKNGEHILVMFSSVFKNKPADAPEQCPCDVTLTLFSSGS
jgi:hypothetical protein